MALPPVVVQLIADAKQYNAEMDKATAKMDVFGKTSETSGAKMAGFANKASTAIIAAGGAIIAYGVDSALKYEKALNDIRNQSGASAAEINRLKGEILSISSATSVSTSDLATAALAVEQAGIRGAAAQNLLNNAAKASVITNTAVVDITHSLIAAQALHISQGYGITKLTGILVAGAKDFTGGLAAEEKMLSGRVGVALANYGLKLKQIIPLGAEFSKVGLDARGIKSFTTGLAAIDKPMTDSKGHFTTYVKNLAALGINAYTLHSDLIRGNIPALLGEISSAAQKGGGSLATYTNAVFGTGGGAAASVVIKNLKEYVKIQKEVSGAGVGSLATTWGITQQQLDFRIKKLKTDLHNAMTGLGLLLLPAVSDVANWASNVFKFFQKHPLVAKIASDTAIATFAAAVAYKIGKGLYDAVKFVQGLFTGTAMTANTAATVANTEALLGTSGARALGGGLMLGETAGLGTTGLSFGKSVSVFAAGVIAFEATSMALRTSIGQKVGNILLSGGSLNPLNDIANLLASKVNATPNKYNARNQAIVAAANKKVYVNHRTHWGH